MHQNSTFSSKAFTSQQLLGLEESQQSIPDLTAKLHHSDDTIMEVLWEDSWMSPRGGKYCPTHTLHVWANVHGFE